jgi:hypothetical protein
MDLSSNPSALLSLISGEIRQWWDQEASDWDDVVDAEGEDSGGR